VRFLQWKRLVESDQKESQKLLAGVDEKFWIAIIEGGGGFLELPRRGIEGAPDLQ